MQWASGANNEAIHAVSMLPPTCFVGAIHRTFSSCDRLYPLAHLKVEHLATPDELAALRAPRDDLVGEMVVDGSGGLRFEAAEGPFKSYERTLEVGDPDSSGRVPVAERIRFRLDIPFWTVAITPFAWWSLRRRHDDKMPWWSPPERFDRRSARVAALLCTMAVLAGYLGTLLSQTITFAAKDFGAGTETRAQGIVLAAARVGIFVTVWMVARADREGRRRILLLSAAVGSMLAVLTAASTNLWTFGIAQALARSMSTALALLIGIIAAEETPSGSRAYVTSVIAMVAGLGAGMVIWFLPLADISEGSWRLIFLLPLLGLPLTYSVARHLPESKRFVEVQERARQVDKAVWGKRLALLAVTALLLSMFSTPGSQFENQYLREERGFDATKISLYQLITGTPIGIGILIGGRLADTRGRRIVGAVAVVLGALFLVLRYSNEGWPLWFAGIVGGIIGPAAIPALGVYSPELFGTANRGKASGLITIVGVVGSVIGLLAVGEAVERFGSFGPIFLVLSAGPAIVAFLIIRYFPETAGQSLEDINPEDGVSEPG